MFDTVLKLVGPLERFVAWVRPAIKADVTYLRYDANKNDPSSPIVVLSPYGAHYFAEIEFTNRSNVVAFIKRIILTVDGCRPLKWSETKPIRLEPREPRTERIIFPLSSHDEPVEVGEFSLEIVRSVGRGTRVNSRFPI